MMSVDELMIDATEMYARVREAEWAGDSRYPSLQMMLGEQLVRITAMSGKAVNVCTCGSVYFQDDGCHCEDWIKDAEDAYANTMFVIGAAYVPPEYRAKPLSKVVFMRDWVANKR